MSLFNSRSILNEFNEVEFESFTLFLKSLELRILELKKDHILLVPITDIKEFDAFVKLITTTYLTHKANIVLEIEQDLFKDVFERCKDLKNKRFGIMTSSDCSYGRGEFMNIEGYKLWTEINRLYIKIKINYDNIEEMVSRIITAYVKQGWRFFKLMFDYESFNKMPLEEFHKLRFWLYEIVTWCMSSQPQERNPKIRETQQPIVLYRRGFKTIFISDNYKLYLNKQAFDEGEELFDLGKHIDHNGEQVPHKELNKLRSYIDLKDDMYGFKNVNHRYLDFYQNLKIMGHINEVQ
ncbi:MAG: hypothetical protein V3V14_08380, partial [Saprospiraceae bacterium]